MLTPQQVVGYSPSLSDRLQFYHLRIFSFKGPQQRKHAVLSKKIIFTYKQNSTKKITLRNNNNSITSLVNTTTKFLRIFIQFKKCKFLRWWTRTWLQCGWTDSWHFFSLNYFCVLTQKNVPAHTIFLHHINYIF